MGRIVSPTYSELSKRCQDFASEIMTQRKQIEQLQAENKELKDFIESTDNKEAFVDFRNCNK